MNPQEKLALLALDLTKTFPRSPRESFAGYVVAGRTLDKCRAVMAGTEGEYHFDCPLDRTFFDFTGIDSGAFKEFVGTGATDDEVASWIGEHSQIKERIDIIQWNNKMRHMRPSEMSPDLQEFLETYIPENLRQNRPVYVWFDVYDIEEERL